MAGVGLKLPLIRAFIFYSRIRSAEGWFQYGTQLSAVSFQFVHR